MKDIDCKNLWIMKVYKYPFCDLAVNTWYKASRIDASFHDGSLSFYVPLGDRPGIALIKCANIFAKQNDGAPFYILKKSVGRPDHCQGSPDFEKIKDYIDSMPLDSST